MKGYIYIVLILQIHACNQEELPLWLAGRLFGRQSAESMCNRVVDWVRDHQETFVDVCRSALQSRNFTVDCFCACVVANAQPVNKMLLYVLSRIMEQRIAVLLRDGSVWSANDSDNYDEVSEKDGFVFVFQGEGVYKVTTPLSEEEYRQHSNELNF